jgi:hypothetical protein
MTPDGYLYRVQAVLRFLGHITAFYNEADADCPPELFGYGLSVILGNIEDDITRAHNGLTEKPKEDR